jgi:hypothetical protein
MSKAKVIIAAILVGMALLIGGLYPTVSQPTGQRVAEVTPTSEQGAPACGGSSCGG